MQACWPSSYDGRLMDDTSPTSNSSDIDEIGGDDESLTMTVEV
jgi:hypothetical protein